MTSVLPAAVADALSAVTPDRLVAVLRELLAVPTVTGSAAESEGQHAMARRLDGLGLETDLWEIDLDRTVRVEGFPGTEAPRSEAWGVVGTRPGLADGPTLVLNGHLDVVPLGNPAAWTVDPWAGVVRDGLVYGRGACDMKGGLACALVALEVLRGVPLLGRVALHSVVSEEDGGLGAFATLLRGHTGDAAVISEPTSLSVLPACAGALTFRLTVRGQAAHASVRDEGVDVVDKYLLVHTALRELEARRNRDAHPLMAGSPIPYPLSVGVLRAGDWASSVPDLLHAEGRLGVALGESPDAARLDLERCLADLGARDAWLAEHPVTVEWYGGQFAPGMLTDGDPLLEHVVAAHTHLHGTPPAVAGAPYGSDLRLLTGAGIPTLLYGPGSVRVAHSPDEHVPVQELVDVARTLVLLVSRFCGVSGGWPPRGR